MKKSTQLEQEKLLKKLETNRVSLMSFPGVHYLDVGYRFKNGRPTEELAIRVHVFEKKPSGNLDPAQLLPTNLDGIKVDVLQSRPKNHLKTALERDGRFNPLLGGIAIQNKRYDYFGTLGVIVHDQLNSAVMGLSNFHVLVGDQGRVGDAITQPATGETADVVATLTRWDSKLDCAVCTFNQSRQTTARILGIPCVPTTVGEPVIGMRVTKSGRTTGTTFGIIDGVSSDTISIIPDPERLSPDGEISSPGDSGALWLEVGTCSALGLHFAGESDPSPSAERALAKQMSKVVRSLKISLLENGQIDREAIWNKRLSS